MHIAFDNLPPRRPAPPGWRPVPGEIVGFAGRYGIFLPASLGHINARFIHSGSSRVLDIYTDSMEGIIRDDNPYVGVKISDSIVPLLTPDPYTGNDEVSATFRGIKLIANGSYYATHAPMCGMVEVVYFDVNGHPPNMSCKRTPGGAIKEWIALPYSGNRYSAEFPITKHNIMAWLFREAAKQAAFREDREPCDIDYAGLPEISPYPTYAFEPTPR